jgi:hypothetical protein
MPIPEDRSLHLLMQLHSTKPSPHQTVAAVVVGVSCFTEELHTGFWADMADTLSAGLDAEASDRTVPALLGRARPADKLYITDTCFALASVRSFCTLGSVAMQRGLRSALQVCLLKSSMRRAVDAGSILTF